MNKQISRLAIVAMVLISALILATTYWQAWAAGGLADRQDNAIQQVAQFTIKRGLIYASDGKTVLAANKPTKTGDQVLFFRRYPKGPLTTHVVGYSTRYRNRAGLERSENDYLTGATAILARSSRPRSTGSRARPSRGTASSSASTRICRRSRTVRSRGSAARSSLSSRRPDGCS